MLDQKAQELAESMATMCEYFGVRLKDVALAALQKSEEINPENQKRLEALLNEFKHPILTNPAVQAEAEQVVTQSLPAPPAEEQRSSLSVQDLKLQYSIATAALEQVNQLQAIVNKQYPQIMKLLLCYSGQKSVELCDAIETRVSGRETDYNLERINIGESAYESEVKRLIENNQSNRAMWVIITDGNLDLKQRQTFSGIPAFDKIILPLDWRKPSGFVNGIFNEIESRVSIRKGLSPKDDTDGIQIDYTKMSYDTVAQHLAHACGKHLIQRISRNLVQENSSVVSKNSKLLQALVGGGMVQPPIMGNPPSGEADVVASLKIAWDAYLYPKCEPLSIDGEQHIKLRGVATWESLFTLFYATFVYCGFQKLIVKAEDKNKIVISFRPKEAHSDDYSQPTANVTKSDEFDVVFDQLIQKAQKQSKFLELSKDKFSITITIQK
jgi:hypothetical protein